MTTEIILRPQGEPLTIPAINGDAGDHASRRFLEFFTANIFKRNTRVVYAQAIAQFLRWCEQRRLRLRDIEPMTVAGYIEAHPGADPTDYYQNGKRWWLRLHEEGGKFHEVHAHHNADAYLDAYIEALDVARDRKSPLFELIYRGPDAEARGSCVAHSAHQDPDAGKVAGRVRRERPPGAMGVRH